jgi:hypothetical protein
MPNQPPIQWILEAISQGIQRHGADHPYPSSVDVKNAWSYTSIPYILTARYLIQHMDKLITFTAVMCWRNGGSTILKSTTDSGKHPAVKVSYIMYSRTHQVTLRSPTYVYYNSVRPLKSAVRANCIKTVNKSNQPRDRTHVLYIVSIILP